MLLHSIKSFSMAVCVASLGLLFTPAACARDDALNSLFDEMEKDGESGQTAPAKPKKKSEPAQVPVNPLGIWTGKVSQPNSSDQKTYTVEIDIYQGSDGMVFDSWYPELNCGGSGKLTGRLPNGGTFYETISEGRETCIDGPFTVTSLPGGKLFWDWGNNQATATLEKTQDN